MKLFPVTYTIRIGKIHLDILSLVLSNSEGILQKDIAKKLGLSKKTVSICKQDLIKLGFLKELEMANSKEIKIGLNAKKEAERFLGWAIFRNNYINGQALLGTMKKPLKTILIRPHHIIAKAVCPENKEIKTRKIEELSKKYRITINNLINNKEYVIYTDYGNIFLYADSPIVTLCGNPFPLPFTENELEHAEDYIKCLIADRIEGMLNILGFGKLQLNNLTYLKTLHIGILLTDKRFKKLHLNAEFEALKLEADNSVYGFKEIEGKGNLDEVLERIKKAINLIFEAEFHGIDSIQKAIKFIEVYEKQMQ